MSQKAMSKERHVFIGEKYLHYVSVAIVVVLFLVSCSESVDACIARAKKKARECRAEAENLPTMVDVYNAKAICDATEAKEIAACYKE